MILEDQKQGLEKSHVSGKLVSMRYDHVCF